MRGPPPCHRRDVLFGKLKKAKHTSHGVVEAVEEILELDVERVRVSLHVAVGQRQHAQLIVSHANLSHHGLLGGGGAEVVRVRHPSVVARKLNLKEGIFF